MLLRSFTLATNLPRSMKPLTVWRRYNGRAPNPMVPVRGFPGRMTGSIGGPVGRLGQAA